MELAVAIFTVGPVLVSVIVYISEIPTRRQAATLAAWNVVVQTETKRPSAGREDALRLLKERKESLAGIVLAEAILRDIDLTEAEISYGSFRNIDCTRCTFRKASLLGAQLQGGQYRRGCDFSGAVLEDTQINGARFPDCKFDGASLHRAQGDDHTSFNGASLQAAAISNANLSGAVFDNARMTNVRLTSSNLDRASFQRVDASGWRWTAVHGEATKFKIHGEKPVFDRGTNLRLAQFDGSEIDGAIFEDVNLEGAHFFKASLKNAIFKDCDLSGTNFTSADLSGARFENCKIEGAIFRDSKINSVSAFQGCQGMPIDVPKS